MQVADKLAKEKLIREISENRSLSSRTREEFAQLIRNTDLTARTTLLDAADVFYPPDEGDALYPHTLNMNDTFGWAMAWGEPVPDDKLQEVTALFARYGSHGLNYWVSEQNEKMRSAFEDINRGIDFVRQEEQLRAAVPSSTQRAYLKHSYVLGNEIATDEYEQGYRHAMARKGKSTAALELEIARLRQSFKTYAFHTFNCAVHHTRAPCDCGFDQANKQGRRRMKWELLFLLLGHR